MTLLNGMKIAIGKLFLILSATLNPSDSTFIPSYITNLKTGVQYKWNGSGWLLSFEGEYPKGTEGSLSHIINYMSSKITGVEHSSTL